MKVLALISAMIIFFAIALQNAVKDMTYSRATTQIQQVKTTETKDVKAATLKAFKIANTKTVAVK